MCKIERALMQLEVRASGIAFKMINCLAAIWCCNHVMLILIDYITQFTRYKGQQSDSYLHFILLNKLCSILEKVRYVRMFNIRQYDVLFGMLFYVPFKTFFLLM